jgi:hypothetical protein
MKALKPGRLRTAPERQLAGRSQLHNGKRESATDEVARLGSRIKPL